MVVLLLLLQMKAANRRGARLRQRDKAVSSDGLILPGRCLKERG